MNGFVGIIWGYDDCCIILIFIVKSNFIGDKGNTHNRELQPWHLCPFLYVTIAHLSLPQSWFMSWCSAIIYPWTNFELWVDFCLNYFIVYAFIEMDSQDHKNMFFTSQIRTLTLTIYSWVKLNSIKCWWKTLHPYTNLRYLQLKNTNECQFHPRGRHYLFQRDWILV